MNQRDHIISLLGEEIVMAFSQGNVDPREALSILGELCGSVEGFTIDKAKLDPTEARQIVDAGLATGRSTVDGLMLRRRNRS